MHGLIFVSMFRMAEQTLGRYVVTELWLELGRYVAIERNTRSVVV